jgi:sulfoxide reductase catalytic subunit YedY
MLIGKPPDIPSYEITSREAYLHYLSRRRFLKGAAAASVAALAANRLSQLISPRTAVRAGTKLQTVPSPLTTTGEQLTPYDDITHYNNFYEFGVGKGDPSKNAGGLPTRPWTVKVDGKVAKPLTFDIDMLLKLHPLEDRVYRHRCVEAWSMVIPWVGYSLSEFIKQCNPLPSAKYVQFISYYSSRVEQWAGQDPGIYWPYSEGLRMDEAMHPLTLLTFGLYGETLPNQDGAPVRIVVPWKYGFKSAKSIVTVRFSDKQPPTTWNDQASDEYGFYSNVNPNVDRVPWSQKTERRIGLPFYQQNRTTLMFNGYTDQVGSLYAGMDLRKNY